ncbi:MAG TPA: FAD-dependent monooxygenase, partial [Caldilineaceae bacterium]|nr:FAD-dependent monooxygenase [Caldilineaceae bacterium]
PPVRRQKLDLGPFALVGTPPPAGEVADGYAPRRTILDQILVEGAVAAGAELREHFSVQELLTDGERVTGIRGHTVGGATVTERARVVIGADGLRSLVARKVQAQSYNVRPTFTCAFYSYWSDVPVGGAELYPRPGRMITTVPTNDGQTLVIVLWPNAAFQEIRADIEASFLNALELAPSLAERVRNGRRSERFRGTADLPNFFRRSAGPGWALVGDAGYHKDPILAQGISDSFRDAELLAAALDDGLSGRRSLDDALAGYVRRRDELAAQGFEMTCQFATLEPPRPEMQQLFAALRGNQEGINRLFGTFAGTVPASAFYAPENLSRMMAAGTQGAPA